MIRNGVVGIMLLAGVSGAFAADWTLLEREPNNYFLFVDKSSVRKTAPTTFTVWMRLMFDKPTHESPTAPLIVRADQHLTINCSTRQSSATSLQGYDEHKVIVYQLNRPSAFQDIAPDTAIETVANKVCGG